MFLSADRDNDPGLIKDILLSSPRFYSLILNRLPAITHIETKTTIEAGLVLVARQLTVKLRIKNVDTLGVKIFM